MKPIALSGDGGNLVEHNKNCKKREKPIQKNFGENREFTIAFVVGGGIVVKLIAQGGLK